MNGTEIAWNYAVMVGTDANGAPVFYKEGCSDSSVALPTGAAAAQLGDGSLVLHSNTGDVKIYNRKTDTWRTLVSIQ